MAESDSTPAPPAASTPSAPDPAGPGPDPRRWYALSVLLIVQFMLILDGSVVTIALPTIGADLGFSRTGLVWVLDAYVLTAGGLLLLGGRLGDVLGRRRVFLAGVVVFGVSSVACALATNATTLVVARFVQGGGEALAAPAALGLIALLFTTKGERAKAIGLFGGASGLGGTAGPIVSGAFVEYANWRWIFLVNIPVAVAALVLVPRLVQADRPFTGSRAIDVVGALLAVAAPTAIVFGAVQAGANPWGSTRVLLPLLGGVVLLAAFVARQHWARNALVPLRFFTDRVRAAGNAVSVAFYAVFLGQFFLTTLYLQEVLGYTALQAGLSYLPFGVVIGAGIGAATALTPKLGLRTVLTVGVLLTAAGAGLFTRITADGTFLTQVLPASVLLALGSGLVLPCLSNAAVNAVTDEDAGLASGVQQALQQVGGAVGLAVLATLAVNRTRDRVAGGTAGDVAAAQGYAFGFGVGAALLLVAAVLAATLVPGRAGRENHEPAAGPASGTAAVTP